MRRGGGVEGSAQMVPCDGQRTTVGAGCPPGARLITALLRAMCLVLIPAWRCELGSARGSSRAALQQGCEAPLDFFLVRMSGRGG